MASVIRLDFRLVWPEFNFALMKEYYSSDGDCRRLIATLERPIYRGCFTLIYAYGLRISEAVTLPITAVDSKQMVLRVIGKRNKERAMP